MHDENDERLLTNKSSIQQLSRTKKRHKTNRPTKRIEPNWPDMSTRPTTTTTTEIKLVNRRIRNISAEAARYLSHLYKAGSQLGNRTDPKFY
jgi:hypothetical protein